LRLVETMSRAEYRSCFSSGSSGKKLSRMNLIKALRVGSRFRGIVMTSVLSF